MRVIGGSARRLILKTLPGNDTRPTTDIIKETLFNMINFNLPGSVFLDLFAGSGAIGIEALSRGAEKAVFIDNNPKAVEIIKDNLIHTHMDDKSDVLTSDAVSGIKRLERTFDGVFSIVFMDPPYDKHLEDAALIQLYDSKLIDEDTMIIVEMSRLADTERFSDLGYEISKVKEYKTNKHIFLRRK